MVPPSGLAETVTPPRFSPLDDLIDPLRLWSAAWAGATVVSASSASAPRLLNAVLPNPRPFAFRMAFLRLVRRLLWRLLWRRRRYRLEIGGDRVDLVRRVGQLEARHAGRAVRDEVAQCGCVP